MVAQLGIFNFGNTSPRVLVASQLKLQRWTAECSASLSRAQAAWKRLEVKSQINRQQKALVSFRYQAGDPPAIASGFSRRIAWERYTYRTYKQEWSIARTFCNQTNHSS